MVSVKEDFLFSVFNAVRLQPETGQQAASWDHAELSTACYKPADFYQQAHGATTCSTMTVPPKSVNSGNKGTNGDL